MVTQLLLKFTALISFFIIFGSSMTPFRALAQADKVLMTIDGKEFYKSDFDKIYIKTDPDSKSSNDPQWKKDYLELYINYKLKVMEAEQLRMDTSASFRNELKGYYDQLAKPYLTDDVALNRLVREAYEREKQVFRVSHIFFRVNANASSEDTLSAYNKAQQVRRILLNGESFEQMAIKYSEDPSAVDREATEQKPAAKGNKGDIGYFTVFDMIYPFETAVYQSDVGDISEPVRTEYGYHLIKTTDKKPAFGKVTAAHIYISIQKNATHDDSIQCRNKAFNVYSRLKAGDNFENLASTYSDDKGSATSGGRLSSFGVNRMAAEFVLAIYSIPSPGNYTEPVLTPYGWHIIKLIERKLPGSFDDEQADLLSRIKKDKRIAYATLPDDKQYEQNPDFIYALNQYREGILLFDLTDQKVWSKAIKDTIGLEKFYKNNKSNYNFAYEKKTGVLTADYQNYLENEWIKKLRSEHTIEIFDDVLALPFNLTAQNQIVKKSTGNIAKQTSTPAELQVKADTRQSATQVRTDNTPPVITITSPSIQRGFKKVETQKQLTVAGKVTDASGIYELAINGEETPVNNDGTFSKTILLAIGINKITIIASDTKKNTASEEILIERFVPQSPIAQAEKTSRKDYALIFSSDIYDNWGKLINPVFDGNTMASELKDNYGFITEVVLNPSTMGVMSKLKAYASKKYDKQDQIFIFFAGHGQYDEIFKEGYIVCKNSLLNDEGKTSYISHSVLRTVINNIPCEHIFLVMDVCFGGTFDPLLASNERGFDEYSEITDAEFIARKMKYKTRKYITSGGKEYVPDGRMGQHSPFTRRMLEAFRTYGGKDKILTIPEIITFVEKVNPQPHFGEFGDNQPGSDFLFISK